jgi:hypothetical protein
MQVNDTDAGRVAAVRGEIIPVRPSTYRALLHFATEIQHEGVALALTILIGVPTFANQAHAGPSPSSPDFGGGGY